MNTPDFTIDISFEKTPQEVFAAISNVRGWWQGKIEGNTEKQGEEFTYRMKDFHFSRQRITEMINNQKVIWLVTESRLSFLENKEEWTGTSIIFEIAAAGDNTNLHFTHRGLNRGLECFNSCSGGWSKLIATSLQSLINTGKGEDVFS